MFTSCSFFTFISLTKFGFAFDISFRSLLLSFTNHLLVCSLRFRSLPSFEKMYRILHSVFLQNSSFSILFELIDRALTKLCFVSSNFMIMLISWSVSLWRSLFSMKSPIILHIFLRKFHE